MLHYKKEGMLYIVSAPSGAGKTTLCKELAGVMPALSHSISHTTRKPRPGEAEGEHYYFVSEDEFMSIAGARGFVEWANVHGNYYGTSKKELERLFGLGRDVILDIDTQGARQIRQSGIPGVFIFILPPSMQELERRLRGRDSDDEAEIARRLKRAVDEIKSFEEYDYIVVNENLKTALDTLMSVLVAERNRIANIDSRWIRENFGI
ncbi:MAG TPA: guanylate kinase [Nitrospirota bacterium]|jgi:guanylate kinase